MAGYFCDEPRRSLWPQVRRAVAQNFIDQWILVAFGTLGGLAVLLISMSDDGRPSIARVGLCLLAPSLATSLLIIADGLATAIAAVLKIRANTAHNTARAFALPDFGEFGDR